MGSCLTFILALTTILFTYTKVVTLVDKNDVDIMSALLEGKIDYETKFTT